MTGSSPAAPQRRLLLPGILTLIGVAVTMALGTWQAERKAWKEELIARLSARFAAAPAPLPAPTEWPRLAAAQAEFQRVAFTATFLHDKEALVYTTGSRLHEGPGGPGYWVFTPARLADGAIVLVNRGFVPEGRQDPNSRRDGQVAGPAEITGVLRWPETRSVFTPNDDPVRNLWFARDPAAIAKAKGVAASPFYVEQEAPMPPGGLPRAGRLRPNLPNNHLGYALTWFGLAAGLVAVFAIWAQRGRQEETRA
jgi:surfeit locus 1 family protein